jgi:uncharacterized protein
MNPYDQLVPQLTKMLQSVLRWLDAGADFAKKKNFEPDRLMGFRLAPDMYSLVEQIQSLADIAKFTCAYLAGKPAPSHPDTETTLDEARTRLRTVIAYLETFKRDDFEGAAERKVSPRWMAGKWARGEDYLFQVALPDFYFHCVTAYGILRHIGVDVGKADFLGPLPTRD